VAGLRTWAADQYYTGGSTYSDFSKSILNTGTCKGLCRDAFDMIGLSIPNKIPYPICHCWTIPRRVGSVDDPIYETERNGEVLYEIPVPPGSYEIALHFAET
jgi:Malectin domain